MSNRLPLLIAGRLSFTRDAALAGTLYVAPNGSDTNGLALCKLHHAAFDSFLVKKSLTAVQAERSSLEIRQLGDLRRQLLNPPSGNSLVPLS